MSVSMISDPIQYAPVSRRYRHVVAGALALALHAGLIVGLAHWEVVPTQAAPASRGLDVVLVRAPAPKPVEASAIGAADQRARGERQASSEALQTPSADESQADTSAPTAPLAPEVAKAIREPPTLASPPPASAATQEASASAASEGEEEPQAATPLRRTTPESAAPRRQAPPPKPASAAEPQAAPQAASEKPPAAPSERRPSASELLAQATSSVREQGFVASREPDAPPQSAATQAAEARYIADWTRRVEQYGNLHYPAPSHLEGQLRIRVVIGSDGRLREVQVLQSSGFAELDQAALDTVRGAAPYRPFDTGLAGRDSLVITRIWRFGKGNNFGVH
ncbi:energy transducer TonB [Halomonas sp. WWR20]